MLQSLATISDKKRISSVDIFRAIAIISVVLFHYNDLLPYGYIGVDLFFVVSGLLVSAFLIKDFTDHKRVNFSKFFLQRGFKIWPSYFVFILVGNAIAYTFFRSFGPDQYIQLWDLKRYLFFYQNYSGAPYHLTFDGAWSLCVEEHFYILLPIGFIVLQKFNGNKKMLFRTVILTIALGFVFKICSLYLTNSQDTFSGTHNRIDALSWGVLLRLIIVYYPGFLKNRKAIWLFAFGIFVLCGNLIFNTQTSYIFYHKVLFSSLTAISFFLMIAGLYHRDFSNLKPLRFIAYYSYNLYLWHPVVRAPIAHYTSYSFTGFFIYISFSLLIAMFFTIIVEEPILKQRKAIIDKLFNRHIVKQAVLAEER